MVDGGTACQRQVRQVAAAVVQEGAEQRVGLVPISLLIEKWRAAIVAGEIVPVGYDGGVCEPFEKFIDGQIIFKIFLLN